jgi:hypothetical protein
MNILAGSNVTITNSSFINGFSMQGGAIYTLGSTIILVENSIF